MGNTSFVDHEIQI